MIEQYIGLSGNHSIFIHSPYLLIIIAQPLCRGEEEGREGGREQREREGEMLNKDLDDILNQH